MGGQGEWWETQRDELIVTMFVIQVVTGFTLSRFCFHEQEI